MIKILLVEDDIIIVASLSEYLNSEGYLVRSVSGQAAAMKLLAEEKADLVLLDVMLPGMDGFETLTRLGGYIMLFSMIASLLQKLPIPRILTLILTGMVEITNGIAMLPDSGLPKSTQYVLAVVYTAFGGLSGIAQTSSMIRDTPLSIKRYCIAKLLLAACCGLLACLVSQIFHL